MIVQLSTGGRSGAGKARGGMLPLRPDMASLTTGSNNFPNRVYENPPDLVDWLASEMLKYDIKPELECFDLSHIVQAAAMQKDGRLNGPLYVQFVMGVKNAMPADERIFDFYIETLKRLAPDAQATPEPAWKTMCVWTKTRWHPPTLRWSSALWPFVKRTIAPLPHGARPGKS
jgi:hypothetical protein